MDTSLAGSAASGKIQVKNTLGKSAESDEEIEIIYSMLNVRDNSDYAHEISLVNADSVNGGYDWFMDDEIQAYNPDDCINRALSTWICLTGINWHLNPVGISGLDNQDPEGKSTIIYGNTINEDAYAETALIGNAIECINDIAVGVWFVKDIDIVFNKSYTFQYDCDLIDTSGGKIDFYETLIHELAHAHTLQHVIDASSVIYTFNEINGS